MRYKKSKLITLGSPINKNIISWFVEKAKEYKRQLNLFLKMVQLSIIILEKI